jgi:hypothetical protein
VAKVSFIIPSRCETDTIKSGETVLQKTLQDIYLNAIGDFEVLVSFDGPPYQDFNYPNLKLLKFPEPIGLKPSINRLAEEASGKYLFKLDAHCSISYGINEVLQMDMEDNWLVMPRFYVLDAWNWRWQDGRFYDYFFLCCPFTDPQGFRFKAGGHWRHRTIERLDVYPIDETPQIHGSGWFINREFFLNDLGGFPKDDPLGHAQEPPNLGLKTWLGPWNGKVMVNKACWYAHWHKTGSRGYYMSRQSAEQTYQQVATYWMSNQWEQRVHDLQWLVEKFWPLPTWPEDWRERWEAWLRE